MTKMRHAKAVLRMFRAGHSIDEVMAWCWGAKTFYTREQIVSVIRRALIRAEKGRRK